MVGESQSPDFILKAASETAKMLGYAPNRGVTPAGDVTLNQTNTTYVVSSADLKTARSNMEQVNSQINREGLTLEAEKQLPTPEAIQTSREPILGETGSKSAGIQEENESERETCPGDTV